MTKWKLIIWINELKRDEDGERETSVAIAVGVTLHTSLYPSFAAISAQPTESLIN